VLLGKALARWHSKAIATKKEVVSMDNITFTELSGRIEGMAQAYLVLGRLLDAAGLVDAQLLQAMLRRRSDALQQRPSTPASQRVMTDLADQLLQMGSRRRPTGH
jgi:hypothetical protein